MGTLHYLPVRRRKVRRATIENMRATPCLAAECKACGERYSANPSDYFWLEPGDVLTCCKRPCILVPRGR